jgi:glycosyltransferase involved in cell wall biosynthesis
VADVVEAAASGLLRAGWPWIVGFAIPFALILFVSAVLIRVTTPTLSARHSDAAASANTKPAAPSVSQSYLMSLVRRWAAALPANGLLFRLLRLPWIFCHVLRTSSVLWDGLRTAEQRYDIVHCNDFDTLIAGILYKRRFGAKLVYDAHEFWPYSYGSPTRLQSWLMLNFERLFVHQADRVLTVNPMLAETMRNVYKLTDIGAVLNAEPWTDDRKPLKQDFPDDVIRAQVRFVFMGGFSPERGLHEFFDAWSKADVRDAVLLVYGPENRAKHDVMEFVKALGQNAQSIHFLPSVAEKNIVAAAMNADVGVIPYPPVTLNYRYCCPNKLSQYMHAGLMVLANDTEFVSSVVQKHQIGLVYDSQQPDSIVRAIKQAAENVLLRKRCQAHSAALAKSLFSWQVQGADLMRIYESLGRVDSGPGETNSKPLRTLGGAVS